MRISNQAKAWPMQVRRPPPKGKKQSGAAAPAGRKRSGLNEWASGNRSSPLVEKAAYPPPPEQRRGEERRRHQHALQPGQERRAQPLRPGRVRDPEDAAQEDGEGDLLEQRLERDAGSRPQAVDHLAGGLLHGAGVASQALPVQERRHELAIAAVFLPVEEEQRAGAQVEGDPGAPRLVLVRLEREDLPDQRGLARNHARRIAGQAQREHRAVQARALRQEAIRITAEAVGLDERVLPGSRGQARVGHGGIVLPLQTYAKGHSE
jgi:hypothetical protein